MWELQGWHTEWEMKGRYVGVTGVVYIMGDGWESAHIIFFSSPRIRTFK